MTPEETREYIDHRLQELGLQLQFDGAAYEKIYGFTTGTEAGANKVCFKLLSLCSDDNTRTISGDTLTTAIDELTRVEELMKRSAKTPSRKHNDEIDRVSIEQLAAVLEANADAAEPEAEAHDTAVATPPARPTARTKPTNGARHPKVLIVNDSQTRRAILVNVLTKNFTCVEVTDAERAWKVLTEQRDIDMVITDLQGHNRNGYDLIVRIRSAGSPHLTGIPIVAVATTDDAHAKQRALAAGADEVIPLNTDAGQLESRVYARYRSTSAAQRAPAQPKPGKARLTEPRVVPSAPARNGRTPRPPAPVLTKPGTTARRPADPLRVDAMRRPFGTPGGLPLKTPVPNFIQRLHQISSTTTITLSATVLVILALTIILYVNRMESGEVAINSANTSVSRLTQSEIAAPTVPAPVPESQVAEPAEPSAETPAPVVPENQINNGSGARDAEAKPNERAAPTAQDQRPLEREPSPTPPAPTAKLDAKSAPEQPEVGRGAPSPPPAPLDSAPGRANVTPNGGAAPAPESEPSAPAQTAAAPVPRTSLTEDDLASLLKRLVFVYEAGDIEQFMNLFAPNARTNDRGNRSGIREDYENLFRTTDLRLMKVSYVSWEVENNRAQGWGNFEVTVRRAGEREPHDYQGSITLYVEKIDGRPRIVRLYHGQRRAGK